MTTHLEELYREDEEGVRAYSEQEIFEGKVVQDHSDQGFWNSSAAQHYPNPFLVKLCQAVWAKKQSCCVIADIWQDSSQENKEMNIVKSGPIPKMYQFPLLFAKFFGKELQL